MGKGFCLVLIELAYGKVGKGRRTLLGDECNIR
jgi:hypothetical protein